MEVDLEAIAALTDAARGAVVPEGDAADGAMLEIGDREHQNAVLHGLYWVPQRDVSKELLTAMTLRPTVSNLAPKSAAKPFDVWVKHPTNGDWIGIPKFLGMSAFGAPNVDKRAEGVLLRARTWSSTVVMRPEQRMGLDATKQMLDKWGGAFFIADCGFGKSKCLARLIHEIGVRAMIVVPQTVLVDQMCAEFGVGGGREPSLTGLAIAVLQGNWAAMKPEKQQSLRNADIVVASLDSLSLFAYPEDFLSQFGLVVFDEAHHMAARTLHAILPRIPARRIVGFSATPERKDGLSTLLHWILGPTAFCFQRRPEVTGRRGTVEVRRVAVPLEFREKTLYGKLAFAEMLNDLAGDAARNAFILDLVKQQLDEGRAKILVITAFREHAEELRDALLKLCDSTVLLHGGLKKKEKKDTSACRVLVATYGILQEGFDDSALDTLVMCTPRSSVQQTVGRIERTRDGKLVPRVLDLVDTPGVFQNMWWARRAFYASRGFTIQNEVERAPRGDFDLSQFEMEME